MRMGHEGGKAFPKSERAFSSPPASPPARRGSQQALLGRPPLATLGWARGPTVAGGRTCGVVAVALVSLDVLRSVTVGRIEEIDVFIVVAGQQFCKTHRQAPGPGTKGGLRPWQGNSSTPAFGLAPQGACGAQTPPGPRSLALGRRAPQASWESAAPRLQSWAALPSPGEDKRRLRPRPPAPHT